MSVFEGAKLAFGSTKPKHFEGCRLLHAAKPSLLLHNLAHNLLSGFAVLRFVLQVRSMGPGLKCHWLANAVRSRFLCEAETEVRLRLGICVMVSLLAAEMWNIATKTEQLESG